MRKSKALARFRKNQTVRMCCLGHYIPAFIKHAAHFGFDCIWLDGEHRDFDGCQIQALLAYAHLHDIDIMLRPPTLEKTRLYRYLEDGAAGLMIPHVNTAEKAKMIVDAIKFPPLGDRGLDAAGLDADYALGPPMDYAAAANAETFLTVQIETHEGVENADAIAAVPGVDAIFVGPGDLGLRIHHRPGELSLDQAFERVAKACKKHGKQWGCPVGNAEILKQRHAQGGRLLNYGGEFLSILTMMAEYAVAFDGLES